MGAFLSQKVDVLGDFCGVACSVKFFWLFWIPSFTNGAVFDAQSWYLSNHCLWSSTDKFVSFLLLSSCSFFKTVCPLNDRVLLVAKAQNRSPGWFEIFQQLWPNYPLDHFYLLQFLEALKQYWIAECLTAPILLFIRSQSVKVEVHGALFLMFPDYMRFFFS